VIINIYLSPPPYPVQPGADFHIGVEKGALFALEKGITLDLIIGDFDSVSEEEKRVLKKTAIPFIEFAKEKDLTDAELALQEALKKDPEKVYIHTASGPRIDHLYANLRNLIPGVSVLVGPTFKAYRLAAGHHTISPVFKYVSIFAFEPVKALTLSGFKYEAFFPEFGLNQMQGISNEGAGTIDFEAGEILVIESKD
jgi:thiamine pyrophosphokinase